MIRRIVAVCDKDIEYSKAFVSYMSKNKMTGFDYVGFSNPEQILKFSDNNKIAFLIISKTLFDEKLEKLNCKTLFLSEENTNLGNNSIYKYQNINVILKKISTDFHLEIIKTGHQEVMLSVTKLIGIFSPIARCGKSLFSITMAGILANTQNVLYINMEAVCGFDWAYAKDNEADISDLIYELRQGRLDQSLLEQSIKSNSIFDYIPVAECADDLKQIKNEDFTELLGMILKLNKYGTIIIEFTELLDEYISFINNADKIYMPVSDDDISITKLRRFLNLLNRIDESFDKEKIIPLALPKCDDEMNYSPDRLFYSNLGTYIKGILQEE